MKKDWTETDRACPCHIITASDTPGDRFKKFAILSIFPWFTSAAREVAIALYASMNWEKGTVGRRTSIRELAAKANLSKQAVQDGLKILERLGFITLAYVGVGRRGIIAVGAIAAVPAGTVVFDYCSEVSGLSYSGGRFVLLDRTLPPPADCPTEQDTTVLPIRTHCPTEQDAIPSPLILQDLHQLAGRQVERVKASTTERPLTTPHTSMPETNLNKRGFARARVADATRDFRVADGTNLDLGVGYGFDIIGLERGEATRLIADLTKLDPSNTINPGGVWDSLKKWVVKFGPERVRGAIVDMQLKQRSGKLDIPAMRALPSFAGAFQSAQAASERIAAVSAPDGAVRRVSRLDMFGLRK